MGLLRTLKRLKKFRSTLILIFTPILLLPLLIFTPQNLYKELACAYTILLMAVYWVTEVVPLAVTALLPLVFYPLLGVLSAKEVSVQYLKDVNVLFLGGLTVAVAVEHWNLHKRIALKVLTLVGAKPRWLLFGFMITTAFLSMWISNVATTAMMIPIAQAVLDELIAEQKESEGSVDSGRSTPQENDEELNKHSPHHVDPSQHVVCPAQPNPLVAEMGNIGEAQALGARLASTSSYHGDGVVAFTNGGTGYQPVPSRPADYSDIFSMDDELSQVHIKITKPDSPTPTSSPTQNHVPSRLGVIRQGDESPEAPDASTADLLPRGAQPGFYAANFKDRMDREKRSAGMAKALTISVCYAANIGGTATLTGTGPNLIMAGQFKTTYEAAPEVDFGRWALFSTPGMLVFLLLSWFWLQYLFLDINWREIFPCFNKRSIVTIEEEQAEAIIQRQYKELGDMSFAEKSVLVLFIILALLWLTRDPGFVSGWGSLTIFKERYVSDATVAMLITFILFVFPSKRPNFFCCRARGDASEEGPVPALLSWKVVQQKMAWNVILLLGGGFAMALGSKESGLSKWIGLQMAPLKFLSPIWANVICCTVICALTQCTSNTATATVFLPILAELAEVLHVNPLYLMLPSTVITSYAFMLPVSTPPNAIAYSYGHLKMMDMVKAGALMNVVGIVIALFSVHAFGGIAFQVFERCPHWLDSDICKNITANLSETTFATSTLSLLNSTVLT